MKPKNVDAYTYNKYLRKYDKDAPENVAKRKAQKNAEIKQTLKNHTFDIINSLIGVAALIVAIIALFRT